MLSERSTASRTGFTIVEVTMAATVLLVGFLGVIQVVVTGAEMLDTSRKQVVAQQLIDFEIEQLRSSTWSRIAGLSSTGSITVADTGQSVSGHTTRFALTNFTASTSDDNSELFNTAAGFTIAYSRTYLRPASATSSTATYLRIAYTVTWTSKTGRAYSRAADAYFGKNGLRLSYQKA